MDNSLILLVVFGIRKHWEHLYKKFSTVFSVLKLFFFFFFFFYEENIIFSALHFNGYGTRLKNYLVVGYVEPLKFNKLVHVILASHQVDQNRHRIVVHSNVSSTRGDPHLRSQSKI